MAEIKCAISHCITQYKAKANVSHNFYKAPYADTEKNIDSHALTNTYTHLWSENSTKHTENELE